MSGWPLYHARVYQSRLVLWVDDHDTIPDKMSMVGSLNVIEDASILQPILVNLVSMIKPHNPYFLEGPCEMWLVCVAALKGC